MKTTALIILIMKLSVNFDDILVNNTHGYIIMLCCFCELLCLCCLIIDNAVPDYMYKHTHT